MKMIITSLLVLATGSAMAHGNLAAQANAAVSTALKVVQRDEPRESLRRFKSISAELVGHETFSVAVGYTDGAQLNYICSEDESVEPVVWGCTKQ